MLVADSRTKAARSASTISQSAILIALQLDEVVAAAERRELDDLFLWRNAPGLCLSVVASRSEGSLIAARRFR
jgi:hypothetical protein